MEELEEQIQDSETDDASSSTASVHEMLAAQHRDKMAIITTVKRKDRRIEELEDELTDLKQDLQIAKLREDDVKRQVDELKRMVSQHEQFEEVRLQEERFEKARAEKIVWII